MSGLVSRKQVTIPANSSVLVDHEIRDVIDYALINVSPLVPIADWQNVTIAGDPTEAGVVLENNGDTDVTINILFEYPHSILGVAQSDTYEGATSAGCPDIPPPVPITNRYLAGLWRTVNILANVATTTNVARANNESTAWQLPRTCKLIGWTLTMTNLGNVQAAAGSALEVYVVRVSKAGVTDAPVLIGTVLVGESNVSKDPLVTDMVFEEGGFAYVRYRTLNTWTGTTCAPATQLEFEEVEA